ncbi:hypothetical protein [Limosilactobacillus ingluviei]|uniref:Uncharacterized protein n=1 Tax=Limosilactobacillus ingluviei TaxID=148604 RepID=A0A0R2GUC8_9LACO|nr:hypothetical protein [Limosilactobacillus ingluviei]KRN44046.1 hypothetical protein IV41_GL000889 [Limosilactobacillus ingluviei]
MMVKGYSAEERLLSARMTAGGITYGEHKKLCEFGCPKCAYFRLAEKKIKANLAASAKELGMTEEKLVSLRKSWYEPEIDHYYPDTCEIYTDEGKISRETYLVLRYKGFIDEDIRNYFGINHSQWQSFKKREFPDFLNKKDYYDEVIAVEGKSAYERWRRSQPIRSVN